MTHFVRLVTSSSIYQFSNFFHCQNQEKIDNNTVTKDPTTPQIACEISIIVLKAATENKTT